MSDIWRSAIPSPVARLSAKYRRPNACASRDQLRGREGADHSHSSIFSKPFGGEYVSLWYDDSDAAEHRVDRRGVRHPLELGPQVFDAETRAWLDMFDFLKSAILSENGGDTADVYKTIWLRRLITTFGWVPYAACGNAPTDIIAYANAGIPLDRPQAARRPITMYARSATDASNAAVSWDAT